MNTDNRKDQYQSNYQEAYSQLNSAQKAAVDTLEGPVMCIAGPGTGKTQLLAVRVGNILQQTDLKPHNILCITYTDAGSYAMKKRLSQFLGTDAYKVGVYTYHAFCAQVIKDNPQYFGTSHELTPVSPLETKQIIQKIIDELPLDHPLKRNKGEMYFDIEPLQKLFDIMKKESISYEQLCIDVENFLEQERQDESYYYKRKTKDKQAGDFKEELFEKIATRMQRTKLAGELLEKYNQKLREANRIDFNDMINLVAEKFSIHDALLANYQERYQYILVDEYQDTNGSQNNLLDLICSFDERPNLFVVGDDDQSIFRFQGANMENILHFVDKYHPAFIVLTENYRSYQYILDGAKNLIENNLNRLSNGSSTITKILKAQRERPDHIEPLIEILEYENENSEEADVLDKISELINSGTQPEEIAIIYRTHKQIENIVKYCKIKKIPITLRLRANVLKEKDAARILKIMEWLKSQGIDKNQEDARLFEILHFSFFDLPANQIAKINYHIYENKSVNKTLRDAISDKSLLESLQVTQQEKFANTSNILEGLLSQMHNVTIQTLFENILNNTGMLDEILIDDNKAWRLQVVNTLFDFIKDENTKREFEVSDLLNELATMEEFNVTLEAQQTIGTSKGINLVTAHSSKGLEYEHVFIIKTLTDAWEKSKDRPTIYPLPQHFHSKLTKEDKEEDERRLFFVAITRAKKKLYISYATTAKDGKDKMPSKFVIEIGTQKLTHPEVSEERQIEYAATILQRELERRNLLNEADLDRMLERFQISTTSLNKYLRCKFSFYFENILRVPSARNANAGYGNAIHAALERFFAEINSSKSIPPSEKLVSYFESSIKTYRSHFTNTEYESYLFEGKRVLPGYYDQYHQTWLGKEFKLEYKINTFLDDIPITGNLDKIIIDRNLMSVVDYKTGKYSSNKDKLRGPTDTEPNGGEYWRQVIFYKILLESDASLKYQFSKAIMDFVDMPSDGNFQKQEYEINQSDVEIVSGLIKETYQNIINKNFNDGCGKPECKWCTFVHQNF